MPNLTIGSSDLMSEGEFLASLDRRISRLETLVFRIYIAGAAATTAIMGLDFFLEVIL